MGSLLHSAINPDETLCRIEFSDGSETMDYVPDDILRHADGNVAVEWWMGEAGPDYKSIVNGTKWAVIVEPKVEH
ncbi:hypothetical protein [Amphritea sp.]|uniref:hypothetical protein n=1 Tax=Amphritea sp. TaxID=1872502 RepID=UPI003563BB54